MRKPRKNYTPVEKVAILRRHLIDRVPVSDLCDEYQLSPTCSTSGRSSSSRTAPPPSSARTPRPRPATSADHRRAAGQAPAQERGRRRIDGGTYPTKKRAWGTLTRAWVPHDIRDAIVDLRPRTGPNAPRSPSDGSSPGWASPPASSTTGRTATAWPTSTTPGPPRLVARGLGEEGHPRLPRRAIPSKATGGSPS